MKEKLQKKKKEKKKNRIKWKRKIKTQKGNNHTIIKLHAAVRTGIHTLRYEIRTSDRNVIASICLPALR
jgi:DNA polymerase III delta prime subunit